MSKASDFGKFYWAVKIPDKESLYLYADSYYIDKSGTLIFNREREGKSQSLFAISSGNWISVAGASVIDGCSVIFDH